MDKYRRESNTFKSEKPKDPQKPGLLQNIYNAAYNIFKSDEGDQGSSQLSQQSRYSMRIGEVDSTAGYGAKDYFGEEEIKGEGDS